MTDSNEAKIRAAFHTQAGFCLASHSPLTAAVCTALGNTLDRETRTGAAILDWAGEPMADALPMRITGALNALARSGDDPGFSALYAAREGDFTDEIRRVMRTWDARLLPWLDGPPQTNEVARSAMLYPGIMAVAARFGPDIELLELGSSAGLNLNLDRFGYDLCGVNAGDPRSPLQLKPDWEGPAPAFSPVNVVARCGIDQNPLDASRPEVAERLLAYVWPDQDKRIARIEAAIALARQYPPPVERGDAAEWLEARLRLPQAERVTRIVFHSIVLQYLSSEGRQRVGAAMARAGAQASEQRPLAWVSMEFHAQTPLAELRVTHWPEGTTQTLADCHPHGASIRWRG